MQPAHAPAPGAPRRRRPRRSVSTSTTIRLTRLPWRSCPILRSLHSALVRAVRRAVHVATALDPVANDANGTVLTLGRERLDGTFKAVERVRAPRLHDHLECLVVLVAADFT